MAYASVCRAPSGTSTYKIHTHKHTHIHTHTHTHTYTHTYTHTHLVLEGARQDIEGSLLAGVFELAREVELHPLDHLIYTYTYT